MTRGKIYDTAEEAIADVAEDASIMLHHLAGPGGVAQDLILALKDKGVTGLTVISLPNLGFWGGLRIKPGGISPYIAPMVLLEKRQIKKCILTWPRGGEGERQVVLEAIGRKEIEAEILPLGVVAHQVRAGGSGIGAFYSPVGIGTLYAEGKERRVINGREYILEYPLRADFGFVRAHKSDTMGNLVYSGTSRGFNPLIAKACNVTIAEVDEIVEDGELDPNIIITSGIYIDRIVKTHRSYSKQ